MLEKREFVDTPLEVAGPWLLLRLWSEESDGSWLGDQPEGGKRQAGERFFEIDGLFTERGARNEADILVLKL